MKKFTLVGLLVFAVAVEVTYGYNYEHIRHKRDTPIPTENAGFNIRKPVDSVVENVRGLISKINPKATATTTTAAPPKVEEPTTSEPEVKTSYLIRKLHKLLRYFGRFINRKVPDDGGVPPKTEKGRLSGVGRDIVKGIGDGISETGKVIGEGVNKVEQGFLKLFNRNSTGLDTNTSLNLDGLKSHIHSIFPGTLWCGGGNISKSDSDLGKFNDTDSCCREHDYCDDNIAADGTKYGLYNAGLFTRSHCKCDTKFYNCLKAANSIISFKIGTTYFTILGPQCFKEDYPIEKCLKWEKTDSGLEKCTSYEQDKSATPVFQWFDNPLY